jgi:hypothetical protein
VDSSDPGGTVIAIEDRAMTKRIIALATCAFLVSMLNNSTFCRAATSEKPAPDSRLIALASAQFPNLTAAERSLLWFSDAMNIDRGAIAVAGPSSDPADPGNDPAHADEWDPQRNVRATLIRWMCADRRAIELEDPGGIRVMGARITGGLDLAHLRVPAPLELRNCSIREEISLDSAEIPGLNLNGTHTGAIYAPGIKVNGELDMGHGFDASAEVVMVDAIIDGPAFFDGGHFHHSIAPRELPPEWAAFESQMKAAMNLHDAQIKGTVGMGNGFQSDGAINMDNASILGDFLCWGGRFINPNNFAVWAPQCVLSHDVHFSDVIFQVPSPHISVVNGVVTFWGARIGGALDVAGVKFAGAPSDNHGLEAAHASMENLFTIGASFSDDAFEHLNGAQIRFIWDDQGSWPRPGKLDIGQLKYQAFGAPSPADVASRLHWLGLSATSADPQPSDELAKYYRNVGDMGSATTVLIARDDALYSRSDPIRRAWGKFLKVTVGYGHEPLRTILWMLGVVLFGAVLVAIGARAGVMRLTWSETTPPPTGGSTAGLNPLLYSLDVFLPFVNLHQEHYWWPDEAASGECVIFGQTIPVHGSMLRHYLWLQIIAGWLLSAIFIAGVTGLIRSD